MRVGSLCTGIAGLELGLRLAGVNTETVFVSDIDPGACDWLQQAMPGVPNLRDFTAYDELPEVDLITAGFPCQPFSTAGKRQGLTDERYLFDDIARLVSRMESRPLLFLENVPGLLTSVSGGEHAMARVVHGLADIGYYITWGTLPAAAVGAPHRRNRWWGLAWHSENVVQEWGVLGSGSGGRSPGPVGGAGRDAADTCGSRCKDECIAVSSESEHAGAGCDRVVSADTSDAERFGPYAPAIARWEHILGRPAPDPTVTGRLNPAFVEHMMGYPEGWVTDILTRRNQALHALGNAVVPQCAAAAFTQLVDRIEP